MSRDARTFAGVVAAVVGCLVGLIILGVYVGLPWLPRPAAAPEEAAALPQAPAVPVAVPGPTPAEVLVRDIGSGPVPSPLKGWVETGQGQPWANVSAWPWLCDPLPGPGPVVGVSRSFSKGKPGQELTDVSGVVVGVAAYGAGQGAVAMEVTGSAAAGCRGAKTTVRLVNGMGVEAFTVSVLAGEEPTTVLLWRRGDVIGQVIARGQTPDVRRIARAVDARLDELLTDEVCPDQESTVADATRSPYVNPEGFTGWERQVEVPFEGPFPTPDTDAPKVSIPGPDQDLPDQPVRPDRPKNDLGLRLPARVPVPEAPDVPAEPGDSVTVPRKVADPVGPGCGWAFTGLESPPASGLTTDADFEEAAQDALDDLADEYEDWAEARADYYEAWAEYLVEVDEYREYVATVEDVEAQWSRMRTLEEQYEAAVEEWEAAVDAREAFLEDQADAQVEYDEAVQDCLDELPPPTDAPEPTDEPSPTGSPTGSEPTGDPTGSEPTTGTSQAAPAATGPAVAALPVALPAQDVEGCPPARPAILDEDPPTVPPSPAPPDGITD